MADPEEERIGRVSFELKQEASVERVLVKIRHHLGRDWLTLSSEDIAALGWLLGHVWTHVGFMTWEKMGLDTVTLPDVGSLVEIARDMQAGKVAEMDGLKQAREILGSL